ncbi:MAG: hypothetical protein QM572_04600 [Nocardioides sp.]|uniref:hypothetical protein n=1 Tax=Nocardioides sp. TaxID=35761 RepID=UPI0039E4B592
MFTHHCSSCDTTYLFFPTDIAALRNTDHGVEIHFDCVCGAPQVEATQHVLAA